MKRIKKIWHENRIIFVLFIILVVCLVAIVTVALTYFISTNRNVYGSRLDNKVEIAKEDKNTYLEALKKDETIKKVDFYVSVRTIYIEIEFKEKVSLIEAQSKAVASLDNLKTEISNYYDVNFTLKQSASEDNSGFTIMGSKNIAGNGIVWNNNTETEEETESE